MINDYREELGLKELYTEEILNITAEKYAAVLFEEKRISHTDKYGKRVLDRYRKEGGTGNKAGEILGTGRSVEGIFTAWKESGTHNRLITGDNWLRIGTAVVEENGVYVAIVLFSVSIVENYVITVNDSYMLSLEIIEGSNNPLFFSNLERDLNKKEMDNSGIYKLFFNRDELPVLLTIMVESNDKLKKTDFLFIDGMKSLKTH